MMMGRRRYLDLILGSFVACALALLIVFVFLIGQERRLFDRTVYVRANFPNVAGLNVGAQVLVAGVAVGSVSEIRFPPVKKESMEQNLTVVMRISENKMPWIRRDSIAHIDSRGLLGEKNVNISLGSSAYPPLLDNDILASVPPFDMSQAFSSAQDVLRDVGQSVTSFRQIIDNFISQKGDMAIAEAVFSIRNIMKEIESGQGLFHEMIYSKTTGERFQNIMAGLDETIVGVKNASIGIETLVQEVKEGKGLAHTLIYGSGEGSFLQNIEAASLDLREMLQNLKKGQGTFGRLLVDPSIYEDLKLILGRVKRNEALKALIRFSLSKKE